MPWNNQTFGLVDQRLGGSRMRVRCLDGKERICRIPGRLKRSLWVREGNIVIMPYTGFPAQSVGMKIADQLLKVDTVAVSDIPTSEVSSLLKGPANTEVFVQVKRGDDTLDFNLTRRKILIKVLKICINFYILILN